MGAAMYAAGQAGDAGDTGASGTGASGAAGDDDVVEAEIVEDEGEQR